MKLALLGDIAFFGKYSTDNSKIYEYFSELSLELKKYDFVIGNLETPLTNSNTTMGAKSAHIKASPQNIKLLEYLNISYVNLANNHIFDYGLEGFLSTCRLLEKNNIKYFGVNDKQCYIESDGTKVALSGFCCYSTNGSGYLVPGSQHGVNILDGFAIEKVLEENAVAGYFNIASFHCGQEHVNMPNYDHILLARKLAAKQPYVFYGHHPHVLQGLEKYRNSILAYSLGNVCFDDVYTSKSDKPLIRQNENNKSSAILSLKLNGDAVTEYSMLPLFDDGIKIRTSDNPSLIEKMNSYSVALSMDKNEYISKRSKIIDAYISARKKKRDLKWYLKRLNFGSVKMILNAKYNNAQYNLNVKHYSEPYDKTER